MATTNSLSSVSSINSGCRPSYRQLSRRSAQQHRCRALERPEQETESSFRSTLEVLKNDIVFLEGRTGLDLQTPLASVAMAHDELVALLNPIAGDRMQRDLEEQIAGLQQQLAVAHQQVHSSEQRMDDTMRNLTELEDKLRRTWTASASTSTTFAESAALALPASSARSAAGPSVSSRVQEQMGTARQQEQQEQPAPLQVPPQERPAQRGQRSMGLESSLELPEGLKNYWYPCEFSSRLGTEMVKLELFEEDWVLFRDEAGAPGCIKDECAHRACPLSLGKLVEGQPQCPYHGWQYDRTGACTKMPSTVFCKGIEVSALPVVEMDGLIWVWPGDKSAMTAGPPASLCQAPDGFQIHAELVMDVPVEHGLLIENLLDLAHAPFTHTSTFAKGWPVPDVVRFHAGQLLGGHWEPYPIDMEFGPPCMVLSTIGLSQPGKIERGARAAGCTNHLHQLHVCLPSTQGRTKLLYRMSLDFLHWTKRVPGIMSFWESIAEQVLGEDLVLVQGQQDRLRRGADVWRNPVPYDKLGVRYRRWRNAAASGDDTWRRQLEANMRPLSAAELFDHSSDEI